jgi:hypothetical protein
MMRHLHEMLDRHATMYTVGCFAEATRYYSFPLAVHVREDLLVTPTCAEFEQLLRRMVDGYKASGVRQVTWKISAIDLPRDGRFRVWTSWDHLQADRVHPDACQVAQYCRFQNNRLTVEMIHFLDSQIGPATSDPAALLRSA